MANNVKDPVCGMEIQPLEAAATEVHDGRPFHFCSIGCRDTFVKDPHRYAQPAEQHGGQGQPRSL